MQTMTATAENVAGSPAGPLAQALQALRTHWPEYLMEGAGLGTFMVSACVFTVLLAHPASPLLMATGIQQRLVIGIAMGLTNIGIIFSPWGQRSGAHLNPSVTLAFLGLGKIHRWDAVFYVMSQFAGGLLGVLLADRIIGMALSHSNVHYAATVPGPRGPAVAFWAEIVISTLMMATVLTVSNTKRLSRFTPYFAGTLVAAYITLEAPLSGMSMNPARTLASAIPARDWTALWVYFTAPPLAMFFAAQLYRVRWGAHRIFCAKLHHHNDKRCIFRCNYGAM